MIEFGEIEAGYLFTSKELAVLLTAVGGDELAGFSLQDIEQMDRSQVLYQLHILFKKGMLLPKVDDGELEILPAIRPAISACVKAKYILCIEQLNQAKEPFAVCYPSVEGWAIIRPCYELTNGWLLQWRSTAGVIEFLKDNDLLPPNDDGLQHLEERFPFRIEQEPEEDVVPLSAFKWIKDKTQEIISSAKIVRGVLMDWLLTADGKQVYTEERLVNWIEQCAGAY